jgi:agmatinase
MIKARDIDRFGPHGVIEKLKNRVAGTKVYISVDIDVLDPAFAPATGTSEVGGWSTRELLTILDGLEGIEVVGADIGELYHLESLRSRTNISQSKLLPFMTILARSQY